MAGAGEQRRPRARPILTAGAILFGGGYAVLSIASSYGPVAAAPIAAHGLVVGRLAFYGGLALLGLGVVWWLRERPAAAAEDGPDAEPVRDE